MPAFFRTFALILGFMLVTSQPSRADEVSDGLDAVKQKDFATALKDWRQVALPHKGYPGNATAQYLIGVSYANGDGVTQNDRKARWWYELSADQGNAYAENNLGDIYYHGQGTPVDLTKALRYFTAAATKGNASSSFALGLMYGRGEGVPLDYKQAYIWFSRSTKDLMGENYLQAVQDKNLARSKLSASDIADADKTIAADEKIIPGN